MNTTAKQHTSVRIVPLILGFGILIAAYLMPSLGGIDQAGWRALAILAFAIIFWATEVIPPSATAMGILILIPVMGVLSYRDTFSNMGTVMIWRLMSIFIITTAIQKTGLADRIAYRVLLLMKGKVKRTLLCILLLNFLLAFIIPNSYARTVLCVTVIAGWLKAVGVAKDGNIGKAFMIAIPASSSITASAIIVGASVDIFAADLFNTMVGYQWTYFTWMINNVPFCLAMTLVIFVVTIVVFPPEKNELGSGTEEIRAKLDEMGSLGAREWFVLALFVGLLILWFTDVSELIPAEMIGAFLLVFPHRLQVLKWKEAMGSVKWDILLIFGASISMASALQSSGAVAWLAENLFSHFSGVSPVLLVVVVTVFTAVVRLGMSNMTGAVATLLPLLVTVAVGLDVNPVWLGMICVIASCACFFFPAQSTNSLFAYNFGYYQNKDLLRFGLVLFVCFTIVLSVIALFYWPLVTLSIT
jgi:anion transporter